MPSNIDTLVTVFGGSGFIGRHVVRALAKRDYRIRVAVRRPELAGHLQPLGKVGQIHAVQANLRYPASVEAAMRDSHAAINLVGILAEGGAQKFDAVQGVGAGAVAKAADSKSSDKMVFLIGFPRFTTRLLLVVQFTGMERCETGICIQLGSLTSEAEVRPARQDCRCASRH